MSSRPEDRQENLLYFGYGSNMSRKKMAGRGVTGCNTTTDSPSIEFTNAWTGHLKDWQLCFHHRGVPPADPSFASIRPREGDGVYGVVYEIATIAAFERLMRSECVRNPTEMSSYLIIQVHVACFSANYFGESSVKLVNTLVTAPHKKIPRNLEAYLLPSRRYMSWLISGAKEEQLPQEYINRLESLPVAEDWKPSVVEEMGMIVRILGFNLQKANLAHFLDPFLRSGTYAYAYHERLTRKTNTLPHERAMLVTCKLSMFTIYFLPVLLACALFVIRNGPWDSYQKLREREMAPLSLTR
ncbi:Gamma-glutamylcyclotransferase [Gracilaria domingensis]|nr:Gamma-glutamylcyclotransferase [Gracilaria domingensis]